MNPGDSLGYEGSKDSLIIEELLGWIRGSCVIQASSYSRQLRLNAILATLCAGFCNAYASWKCSRHASEQSSSPNRPPVSRTRRELETADKKRNRARVVASSRGSKSAVYTSEPISARLRCYEGHDNAIRANHGIHLQRGRNDVSRASGTGEGEPQKLPICVHE